MLCASHEHYNYVIQRKGKKERKKKQERRKEPKRNRSVVEVSPLNFHVNRASKRCVTNLDESSLTSYSSPVTKQFFAQTAGIARWSWLIRPVAPHASMTSGHKTRRCTHSAPTCLPETEAKEEMSRERRRECYFVLLYRLFSSPSFLFFFFSFCFFVLENYVTLNINSVFRRYSLNFDWKTRTIRIRAWVWTEYDFVRSVETSERWKLLYGSFIIFTIQQIWRVSKLYRLF